MCIHFVQQGVHAQLRVVLIFMALESPFALRIPRIVSIGVL